MPKLLLAVSRIPSWVWALIGGALLAVVAVLVLRREKEDKAEKSVKDEAEAIGVDPKQLRIDAQGLVQSMGVGGTWGWLAWTGIGELVESDAATLAIMKKYREYPPGSFLLLADVYSKMFERNLEVDLRNSLSTTEYQEIADVIYG
ncbi:MAG: hypothetical protein AAFW00_19800 [Bacteroidota bacterium]